MAWLLSLFSAAGAGAASAAPAAAAAAAPAAGAALGAGASAAAPAAAGAGASSLAAAPAAAGVGAASAAPALAPATQAGISAIDPLVGTGGSGIGPPIPDYLRNQMMSERLLEEAPTRARVPGGVQQVLADRTQDIRRQVGLSDELSKPIPSSGAERFFRGVANQKTGGLVGEAPAARFADVSMQQIMDDPALLERWDTLGQDEKAFALLDGTDKATDLLSLPQESYERLFGSSNVSSVNNFLVENEKSGLGSRLGNRFLEGGSRGSQPQVVMDLNEKQPFVVASDDFEGIPRGRELLLTQYEAAPWVSSGHLQSGVSGINEVRPFRSRLTGETRNMTRRIYQSNSDIQSEFFELGGEVEDVLLGGERTTVPREEILMRPAGSVGFEASRGPKAVEGPGGFTGFKDELDLVDQPGFRPQAQRQQIATQTIERATKSRAGGRRLGDLLSDLREAGPRATSFSGKAGVLAANALEWLGNSEAAQEVANLASGGTLAPEDLGRVQKQIKLEAFRMKDDIVGSGVLSNRDMQAINEVVSADEAFSNPKQIESVLTELRKFEIISNELERKAAGEAPQYPVRTEDEQIETGLALESELGGDWQTAAEWVRAMLEYEDLR